MKDIPYGRQNITEDDIAKVINTLRSDYLTQGPEVEKFEKAFSEYIGCKYSAAVANGTAALHLAAMALNVRQGVKVITTPISFSATANCVIYCGGEIDFVDIDPKTYLMDLDQLRNKLLESKNTADYEGIIPVDFAGDSINMKQVKKIADEFNLWIIEDACHAPGGYFVDCNSEKHHCGNGDFGDLSVFSFHPVKHIACGEGGMVCTNHRELDQRIKRLRTHGITKDTKIMNENHGGWYYEMTELGYNYRLTDIQASLGLSQLERASNGLKIRQKIAKKYDQGFAGSSVVTPNFHEGHAYHLYIIQVDNRKELYEHLKRYGILAQVHYIPIHLLPYYKKRDWKKGDFPFAESYYEKCLSLPIFPTLTPEEQDYVIENVLSVAK